MFQKNIKILLVDDDNSLRDMLSIVLKKEGYDVVSLENAMLALKILKKRSFDLIISDIKMPGISGIKLLSKIKSINNEIPIIMITAYASTNDAVEAMKLGAEDYITKPFNLDELKIIINKALYKKNIERENVELRLKLSKEDKFEDMIGNSSKILKIYELINDISKTDSNVLITGESGTGKELIAKAIHSKSLRAAENFVSINCGALPENLLESELFGHIKGSFTDAYKDKMGLFEQAEQGTIFLDEIAEMSQKMQVKLLRAIQERKIRRVGGNLEKEIDVRIISATNRDLEISMKEYEFRADLFYRLNVIPIKVPPLRERRDDIPLLMQHFLDKINKKFGKNIEGFEKKVIDLYMNYSWPGNVRELENFVERAVALEKSNIIKKENTPTDMIYNVSGSEIDREDLAILLYEGDFDFYRYIDNISKNIILKALSMNNSNIKKTAEMMKLSYRSLRYLISKYKLK
jgi:DNA-binding NtrC family response regulator